VKPPTPPRSALDQLDRAALVRLARVLGLLVRVRATRVELLAVIAPDDKPTASLRGVRRRGSLAQLHPSLTAEWHPTKHTGLKPEDVVPGSGTSVWWRCSADPSHIWRSSVRLRVHGGRCPACSGRLATATTSFRAMHPVLAEQWHPTKNGTLSPDDVTVGSGRKVWWRCGVDARHVWCAVVHAVVRSGHGCPFCDGKRTTVPTSLAARLPELAAEWHATKNGALTPRDVRPTSGRSVYWKCTTCRHVWRTAVSHRATRSHGCPVCSHRVVTGKTSLAAKFPTIAAEWHPTKNGALTPNDIVPRSPRDVHWRCARDASHEWRTRVFKRTREKHGCPFCSHKRVSPATSLARVHPRLAREFHPTKNGALTARDVLPGSDRKVWWRCRKAPAHEWEAQVYARARLGTGCPLCLGRVATPTTSLRVTHPALAGEWHATKNGHRAPDDVKAGSDFEAWWRCTKNKKHAWQARVVTRARGAGCPVCAGRVLTSKTSLGARFPEIATQWHPTKNGDQRPEDVTHRSMRKVWWQCQVHASHVWAAMVYNRTLRGSGCPFCTGSLASVTNSLKIRFPAISREWHPTRNGALMPIDVRPFSHRVIWWRCRRDSAHEWKTPVAWRTAKGTGCPACRQMAR
jgi:hypothetical protein